MEVALPDGGDGLDGRDQSPPRAKKLSWMPTRSSPSTSAQASASAASRGERGGASAASRAGSRATAGRRCRACRWRSGGGGRARRTWPGSARRAAARPGRRAARRTRRAGGAPRRGRGGRDDVGDQAGAAERVRLGDDDGVGDGGEGAQGGLDLARLDPMAANLDLAVGPPRNSSVPSARQRARSPSGTDARPGWRRTGPRRPLSGQGRAAEVAAGEAGPADVQLAGTPSGAGVQVTVEDERLPAGQRAADRAAEPGLGDVGVPEGR